MDDLTKEQRHKNMSHIRSRDTGPELMLRRALWKAGVRYRKNDPRLPGRPDIVISRGRIAIFVDGDFFHGRDMEKISRDLKSRREYWLPKIRRNKERDEEVNDLLTEDGWLVLRFWESRIRRELDAVVHEILSYVPPKKETG